METKLPQDMETNHVSEHCPKCLTGYSEYGSYLHQGTCPSCKVHLVQGEASQLALGKVVIWWCDPCRSQWDEDVVMDNGGMCPHNCGTKLVPCALVPQDLPLPKRKHISEFSGKDKTAKNLSFTPLLEDMYHDGIKRGADKLQWDGYGAAHYESQGMRDTIWTLDDKIINVSLDGKRADIRPR